VLNLDGISIGGVDDISRVVDESRTSRDVVAVVLLAGDLKRMTIVPAERVRAII
jgi:hypothetical protein